MKRNSKKNNNYFSNVETNKKSKEKNFQFNNSLLKPNQLILVGKHPILSALNNNKRILHYLITIDANYSKWKDVINKLKLKLDIVLKTREELDKINNYKPHQNVILVAQPLKRLSMDKFLSNCRNWT